MSGRVGHCSAERPVLDMTPCLDLREHEPAMQTQPEPELTHEPSSTGLSIGTLRCISAWRLCCVIQNCAIHVGWSIQVRLWGGVRSAVSGRPRVKSSHVSLL
jgi:hypothetical protein